MEREGGKVNGKKEGRKEVQMRGKEEERRKALCPAVVWIHSASSQSKGRCASGL